MTPEQTTEMLQLVLREALLIAGPILVAASLTSLVVSLLQTLTSIQDQTLSIVPRLLVVAVVVIAGMPWFLRRLMEFTFLLLGDMKRYTT
jgi:flagellar biosynthetic protein FliQ